MRRATLLLLTLALTVLLNGCGESRSDKSVSSIDTPSQTQAVNPPVSSESKETLPPQPINPSTSPNPESSQAAVSGSQNDPPIASIPEEYPKVDIDLTGFSANMLYAEIYNMGMNPDYYKGKVISITGDFATLPNVVDNSGNPIPDGEIFVCLVRDAMACCQSGIEFIPEKTSRFWQERPAEGSKITVTGMCDIFLDEGGWFTIIQLDNAKIEWQN